MSTGLFTLNSSLEIGKYIDVEIIFMGKPRLVNYLSTPQIYHLTSKSRNSSKLPLIT